MTTDGYDLVSRWMEHILHAKPLKQKFYSRWRRYSLAMGMDFLGFNPISHS